MGKHPWFRLAAAGIAAIATAALATGARAFTGPATSAAVGHRQAVEPISYDRNEASFTPAVFVSAVERAIQEVTRSAVTAAMSPRQLAGQRVIYAYSGLTPPTSLLALVRAGEAGGVIFFANNYRNRVQFAAAVRKLVAANRAMTNPARAYPLLLMTDQEGGYVNRLPGGPYHSEKWIGSRPTAGGRSYQARQAGTGAATTLLSFGLNVDLAPVVDVYRLPGDFDDQYQRSYSMNPQVVSNLGADFIRAEQSAGVAATAKHFPGLGAAAAGANTDQRPVTISLSRAALQRTDESPYQAAIAADVDLVMVSWATYPNLGSSVPAGLSPAIVRGQLRGRLHFQGVTITDAIGAGALSSYGSSQNRALRAAEAGMQLILASDSLGQGIQCMQALDSGYKNGSLAAESVRATITQILALRASVKS